MAVIEMDSRQEKELMVFLRMEKLQATTLEIMDVEWNGLE